jgi:hypothetical protein
MKKVVGLYLLYRTFYKLPQINKNTSTIGVVILSFVAEVFLYTFILLSYNLKEKTMNKENRRRFVEKKGCRIGCRIDLSVVPLSYNRLQLTPF